MRSLCVFSLTLDRIVTETWNKRQCICLDKALHLICIMTYLGQFVTLTSGQISIWHFKVTLGQIWPQYYDRKFHGLSNTFFGFSLPIIVLELMKVFWSHVSLLEKQKIFVFLDPGDLNFDFREKLSECFCSAFPNLPNAVFRFSLTCVVFEIVGGGGGNQPPPPRALVFGRNHRVCAG